MNARTSQDVSGAYRIAPGKRTFHSVGFALLHILPAVFLLLISLASSAQSPVQAVAPTLVQSPRAGTALIGKELTLYVGASGTAPLRYQWFKNGVAISGENSSALKFPSVSAGNAGAYSAVVNNALGQIMSASAQLNTTTNPQAATFGGGLPEVFLYDQSGVHYTGDTYLSLSVSSTGVGPFTYKWYKNGLVIAGQTSPNYYNSESLQDAGTVVYSVDVTNSIGTSRGSVPVVIKESLPVFKFDPAIVGPMPVYKGVGFAIGYQLEGSKPMSVSVYRSGNLIFTGAPLEFYERNTSTDADSGVYQVVASNAFGSVSRNVQVTVQSSAPRILSQPTVSIYPYGSGKIVSVSGVVEGDPPLTYQWFRDGASVGSTPGFSYTHAPDNIAHTYYVVISNARGSTQSQTVTSRIYPVITKQPVSQTLQLGSPLELTVTADSTDSVSYQWLKNGSVVGSGPKFAIAQVSAFSSGTYRAVATTQNFSVSSSEVTVTVLDGASPAVQQLKFTLQPVSIVANLGASVELTGSAISTKSVTYQWFKNGQAMNGQIYPTLGLGNVTTASAAVYTLKARTDSSELTSAPARLTIKDGPPTLGRITASGSPAQTFLNIVTGGRMPMTFEWLKDGVLQPGGGLSYYVLTPDSPKGVYTVRVRNELGEATSLPYEPAVVPIIASTFKITSAPSSQAVLTGSLFGLSVTVSGTGPFTYQWLKDGSVLAGATLYYYDIASAAAGNSGKYTVRVTDSAGQALTSEAATVLVSDVAVAPKILRAPVSASVLGGQSVTLSVDALGSPNLEYAWYRDGVVILGPRGNTYAASTAGVYTVRIDNAQGSVVSTGAKVTRQVYPAPLAAPNKVNSPSLEEFTLDGGF